MGRSKKQGGGNPGKTRIYRGYISDTEYKFLLASSLEKAKELFKERYPDTKFIKIKINN